MKRKSDPEEKLNSPSCKKKPRIVQARSKHAFGKDLTCYTCDSILHVTHEHFTVDVETAVPSPQFASTSDLDEDKFLGELLTVIEQEEKKRSSNNNTHRLPLSWTCPVCDCDNMTD